MFQSSPFFVFFPCSRKLTVHLSKDFVISYRYLKSGSISDSFSLALKQSKGAERLLQAKIIIAYLWKAVISSNCETLQLAS